MVEDAGGVRGCVYACPGVGDGRATIHALRPLLDGLGRRGSARVALVGGADAPHDSRPGVPGAEVGPG